MKYAATLVALVLGAVVIAGSNAAVQPKVTRAKAVKRLRGMLGARPQRVQLVWTDETTTDVVLEWTGYTPHARIHVVGGPVGAGKPVSRYYRGPAQAWLAADGGPPMGVGSVRPLRGHHVLPMRSRSLAVSLVSALGRNGVTVSLVPLRIKPTVNRMKAISKLANWGDPKHRLQRIWLVWFQRGDGRRRLAWMALTLHARIPVYGCDGKRCKQWYTSPLASFVDARTGKSIEALTINGLKPQLPPG
jgi:hypothetical protein